MLARHLNRQARPVRYALPPRPPQTPPEHAEAMRNFLALHTRAFDVPHLAHLAQQGGHLQHPLLQQLLQGVLQQHDPAALGMFADVHQDETGIAPTPQLYAGAGHAPDQSHHAVIDVLHALNRVANFGDNDFFSTIGRVPSPAQIHERYATGNLAGLRAASPQGHPYLHGIEHTAPEQHQEAFNAALRHPRPLTLLPAYDAAHALAQGDYVPRTADRARRGIADVLRSHFLPLLHQGLT